MKPTLTLNTMKPTLTVLTALLLAPLAALHAADSSPAPSGPPPDRKWKLVFSDEFNGTAIDEAKWRPSGYTKWEHPGFKTRLAKENCAPDGQGNLIIRITRDPDGTIAYNHGLQTRDFQKAFGFIEARVQFSTQPGWWGHVCLIRNNTLINYGHDLFENPQEFDIFEDFYKPKTHPHWSADRHNVIGQAFHATVDLGFRDQGDGSGVLAHDARKKDILSVTKLGRVLRQQYSKPTEYAGWHTVGLHWSPLEQVFYLDGKETLRLSYKDTPITTVPQKLLTGGVFKTPDPLRKDAPHEGKYPPFYGWLEDAQLPDQLVVDYLRWYDEDADGARTPVVTVDLVHDLTYPTDTFPAGKPLTFRVRAHDADGKLQSVQLFAKGYLRAEAKLDAAQTDQTFTLSNLFDGDNTLIATVMDNDGLVGLSAPVRVKVKPSSQAQLVAPNTVREHLWLFGCPPGGDHGYLENAGYRGGSRMTPVEGAHWLGVQNLLFVTQDHNRPEAMWFESKWKAKTTMEQWAIAFESLNRVNWAAVGSSGGGGLQTVPDIITLAKNYPNFTGIYLDDFVKDPVTRSDGRKVGKPAMTEAELTSMRDQLGKVGRPMEVWTTIYTREFDPKNPDFHDCEPPLVESMKHFDVLVFWTWKSEELKDLEKNLTLLESIKPKTSRIALGIYLWDYTGIDPAKKNDPTYRWGKPVPLDLMEHQCSLGLKWLKEGRVSDLVILANTHLDLGINTAPWMREWIKKHGDEKLNR